MKVVLAAIAPTLCGPALAAPPRNFDQRVEALRTQFGTLGASNATVENCRTALAILVDRGKLDWVDKIIDHMPDFRMYDARVTRETTVHDLLVHRSGLGLGVGDLLFFRRSDLSRKGRRADCASSSPPPVFAVLMPTTTSSMRSPASWLRKSAARRGRVERIAMKPASLAADFSWNYRDLLFTPATLPAGGR